MAFENNSGQPRAVNMDGMRWKQRNTSSGGAEAGGAAIVGVTSVAGITDTAAATSVSAPRITLIGKPGCHLCDDARVVVSRVAQDLAVGWQELDIDQDAALAEKYWEKVPVVLVDGRPHDFWRVDERRLRAAVGC